MNFDFDDPTRRSDASEFLTLVESYDETLKDFDEGEIVHGKVVNIRGTKSSSTSVSRRRRHPDRRFEGHPELKIGDEFDVYLEKMENQDGLIVLSKTRADFLKVWDRIKQAYDNRTPSTVRRPHQGGLVAKLYGVDAFCPARRWALRQCRTRLAHGEKLEFPSSSSTSGVATSSCRAESCRGRARQAEVQAHRRVEKGQVRPGLCQEHHRLGAFVDLGGIDGLLHSHDLSGVASSIRARRADRPDLEVKVLDSIASASGSRSA